MTLCWSWLGIQVPIVNDKLIKMLKLSELITLHKFKFAIILITSLAGQLSQPSMMLHDQRGKYSASLQSTYFSNMHQNIFWTRNKNDVSCCDAVNFSSSCIETFIVLFWRVSVFHCSGGLALIGMLIVFILSGTE